MPNDAAFDHEQVQCVVPNGSGISANYRQPSLLEVMEEIPGGDLMFDPPRLQLQIQHPESL